MQSIRITSSRCSRWGFCYQAHTRATYKSRQSSTCNLHTLTWGCLSRHTITQCNTPLHHQHRCIHKYKQTNLLLRSAIAANSSPRQQWICCTTIHYFPSSVYYTACNFNQQKCTASGVWNPYHIILMTHAHTPSVKHTVASSVSHSSFMEYILHQK